MHLVLNWIWQGGVVALAAAAVLRAISPSRAQARYCAVWAACASVLLLPAVPLLWTFASSMASAGDAAPALAPIVSMPSGWWTSTSVTVGAGAIWSLAYALRVAAAAIAVRRTRARSLELPRAVEARLHHWSQISRTGRRARVVISASVRSAGVLGCGTPVIAIAPALLDRLSDADLDRVMVHEWAHVQRRDDVAQLAQLVVRIVAGWHPALWWLDRQLHLEREAACDDAAVAVTGSAKKYAACLATLASFPAIPARPWPILAVDSGGLRQRIVRILAARHAVPAGSSRFTAVTASVALATVALVVGGQRAVEAAASASAFHMEAAVAAATADARTEAARGVLTAFPIARQATTPESPRLSPARSVKRNAFTQDATPAPTPAVVPSAPATPPPPAERPDGSREALMPSRSTVTYAVLDPSRAADAPAAAAIAADAASPVPEKTAEGWTAAADAGVAVGRASQKAATATAGFFTRFGKKIAGSF